MDLKNNLKIDGFKVLIIVILLLFPFVRFSGISSSNDEFETSFTGNTISFGLPLSYIKMDYISQHEITEPPQYGTGGIITRFTGSHWNFILDIIIAYLIGVVISLGYYRLKKK
jgi:hypothetical protein